MQHYFDEKRRDKSYNTGIAHEQEQVVQPRALFQVRDIPLCQQSFRPAQRQIQNSSNTIALIAAK